MESVLSSGPPPPSTISKSKESNDYYDLESPKNQRPISTSLRMNEKPKLTITNDDQDVFCCRFSGDGSFIAAGGNDGVIRVSSAATGRKAYELISPSKGHGLPLTSLRWRPTTSVQSTKNVLLAGSAEGRITHWHVTSGKCLHEMTEKDNQIYAVDYRADALRFATAGKDKVVRLYDEATRKLITGLSGGMGEQTAGHSNRVFSLKFHPTQDNFLISAGWDNAVQIWDQRTASHSVRSIYGPHIAGDSVDIHGNTILTGSWRPESALQLWDFGTGKLIEEVEWRTPPNETTLIYAAEFSKDGSIFAAGGAGTRNEVKVFDTASCKEIGSYIAEKGIYSLDFSPNSKLLSVAGGDANIKVMQMRTEVAK